MQFHHCLADELDEIPKYVYALRRASAKSDTSSMSESKARHLAELTAVQQRHEQMMISQRRQVLLVHVSVVKYTDFMEIYKLSIIIAPCFPYSSIPLNVITYRQCVPDM